MITDAQYTVAQLLVSLLDKKHGRAQAFFAKPTKGQKNLIVYSDWINVGATGYWAQKFAVGPAKTTQYERSERYSHPWRKVHSFSTQGLVEGQFTVEIRIKEVV